MTGPIDTSGTIAIEQSPWKMLMLLFGSLAFVAAGWWMIGATERTGRQSLETIHFFGWASIVFFGLCALILLWRLATVRGPVITLTPEGIRDTRVSSDIIPWTAIRSITTWSHKGTSAMVLGLRAGEEEKLKLSAITRMTRGANKALGADGLSIVATGTKISHDRLMDTAIAYARRYADA